MKKSVYTKAELYSKGGQRSFPGDASEAAFLLGGIGTGNISLGARGEFRDFEIFNRPAKGSKLPYTFFSIWAKSGSGDPVTKVVESKINPPYSKSHGFSFGEAGGLPRLDSSVLKGEYPFVRIDFEDRDLPVQVGLEAFTPFIPLNADDSGIPCAILRYKVKNTSSVSTDVCMAGSMVNAVGFKGYDIWNNMELSGEQKNELRETDGFRGIYYHAPGMDEMSLQFGSMGLMTRDDSITAKPEWLKGDWSDGIHDFWDDFTEDGKLVAEPVFNATGSKLIEHEKSVKPKVGSLGIYQTLEPGEEKIFEFIVTWYFPNRVKDWDENNCGCCGSGDCGCETVRNYYATWLEDAWDTGRYVVSNMDRLESLSRAFHKALFDSTLPPYVIDAAASNITVIRSTTCFRIEDGRFLGYEGCHTNNGCCPGNCTHVWNYAQTMAFLFPELEQTMRRNEFLLETDDEGMMAFRSQQILDKPKADFLPAVDGQMGTVVRLYREWKISGNNELIEELWPKVIKAIDFAFDYWDTDGDFVLDGQQHVDYDIEFYGPNSLSGSMFYAALKAGVEMAEYLGDSETAARYRKALEEGSGRMDKLLWNGEYYIQKLDNINEHRYQYGEGCLSDQVFGQFLAQIAGLGYVLPREHIKQAIHSVYKYNYRDTLENHSNVQRTYALNDENGLLLASWPHGGRPRIPFVYADEVWTGIEYHVAAHLIYEGFIDEGLTIVKGVRDRHDGYRRNPWNEVECGNHYARSMASWALLTALSGFKYDMVNASMSFDPVINVDDFSTFWSTGKAWGVYRQYKNDKDELKRELEVLYGDLGDIKVSEG